MTEVVVTRSPKKRSDPPWLGGESGFSLEGYGSRPAQNTGTHPHLLEDIFVLQVPQRVWQSA
jgi:hypothetical protein